MIEKGKFLRRLRNKPLEFCCKRPISIANGEAMKFLMSMILAATLAAPAHADEVIIEGLPVMQAADVDIEDLLGRDEVSANREGLSDCISNKVVMVTGAGGSIGSELCRQIIKLNPSRLVLFELSEPAVRKITGLQATG